MTAFAMACGSSNGNGPTPDDAAAEGSMSPGPDAGPESDGNGGDDSTLSTDSNPGPSDGGVTDASGDAGPVMDADAGPFVEAPHPRFPLLVDNGGPTMAAPELTSVTFASTYTNNISDLDALVATLGNQPYWAAATSEYGVATPKVRNPAHLKEAAPTLIDDSQIQTWLAGKFAANDPLFGTPSANTLYVLYYPSTTTITQGGGAGVDASTLPSSCQAFGGYHGFAAVLVGGSTVYVPYAVVPECVTPDGGAGNLGGVTSAASHEMAEAVTDPYVNGENVRTADGGSLPPTVKTAYAGTSTSSTFDPYIVWSVGITGSIGGLENGDMCEGFGSSFFTPTGFPYEVQRTWSNKAVLAGKDPCAPYHTGEATYFAAMPVFDPNFATNEAKNPPVYVPMVNITDNSGSQPFTFQTQGVKIAVGASAVVPVIFFADGPTAPWTVTAADVPLNQPKTPNLTFEWENAVDGGVVTGQNGDVLHLKITVVAADPTINGNAFRLTSTDGVLRHTVYGYVGQN
jgi:hypothetical protein